MSAGLFRPRDPDSVYSEANLITLFRVAASMTFFALAIIHQSPTYNYIGFGIHWVVDFIDGFCARTLKQETVVGAEIDLIADRLELICFYVIFLHFRPQLVLPAMLYLVDYAFVDFYLGYQFTKFDIISPNYFHKVNRTVYRLNFSPVGKFANSSVVTLTLIFLPGLWLWVSLYALGLIVVKSYSVYLVEREKARRRRGGPAPGTAG